MAEGYARATGQPGIVLVTSGPGATNTITALNDAHKDGTPLVVFSGQVSTSSLGTDAFQESDIVSMVQPCTKWSIMVTDVHDLPQCISDAFEVAMSGRPGPVLVDIPRDVSCATLQKPACASSIQPTTTIDNPADVLARNSKQGQHRDTVKRCADLINKAKKPVIYAGQGVIGSPRGPMLLRRLADKACIPVTTTILGLGAFDEFDRKSLHMLGMHGAVYANKAMQEADLIIALGARFDDRVTGNVADFAPVAHAAAAANQGGIIHFDINPMHLNRVVRATEAIDGDVQASLADLLPHVSPVYDRAEWLGQIDSWKKQYPLFSRDTHRHSLSGNRVDPQVVIKRLSEMTRHLRDSTIITTGVGQHQMWAAQHYRFTHPRSMITSGGAGTMGFGLPAAIGAKIARPEGVVIDVDGDASLSMTLSELATAAEFNVGVKILVFNNGSHGMVTQWQDIYYQHRYAHSIQQNPDFVAVSTGMGVPAQRICVPDELDEKLQWLLDAEGPALLDVMVHPQTPLYPLVRFGKALDDMILGD
jgi:acetolactate synthase-1/2/3 large subunit